MRAQALCIFVLPLVFGCAGKLTESDDGTSTWSSESHPVSVEYSAPWKMIDAQHEGADRLVVALQTKPKGQGCIFSIRIGEDVSKDVVSDEQWYQALKDPMLKANEKNELVDEYDVQWQGRTYRRMRFRMVISDTGDRMCQWIDTCRTGTHIITIINAFPFDQGLQNDRDFPSEINEIRSNSSVFAITRENGD